MTLFDGTEWRRAARPVLWSAAVLVGLGTFTFGYGEGHSYLSNTPETCANCHIMQPQLDSYRKAGHHTVAVCVDCHLPHDFLGKWTAKVRSGWNHSVAFTTGRFAEPIVLKPSSSRILRENCVACHGGLVHDLLSGGDLRCVHCHRAAGHGELAGLGGPERGEGPDGGAGSVGGGGPAGAASGGGPAGAGAIQEEGPEWRN